MIGCGKVMFLPLTCLFSCSMFGSSLNLFTLAPRGETKNIVYIQVRRIIEFVKDFTL